MWPPLAAEIAIYCDQLQLLFVCLMRPDATVAGPLEVIQDTVIVVGLLDTGVGGKEKKISLSANAGNGYFITTIHL